MSDYKPNELKPHDFDGIQEYDNQLPRWWIGTFILTLLFAVVYWFYFQITEKGADQATAYTLEWTQHHAMHQAQETTERPFDQAELEVVLADPKAMALAQTAFGSTCAACHGAEAQGVIGPNLTDAAWIHGGTSQDIYHTIEAGVAAKGMPAWHGILSSGQIRAITAYILSLQGTTPPNAKAPEGVMTP